MIKSVRGVGFPVLAVTTSYPAEKLQAANYVVKDLNPQTVGAAVPELLLES